MLTCDRVTKLTSLLRTSIRACGKLTRDQYVTGGIIPGPEVEGRQLHTGLRVKKYNGWDTLGAGLQLVFLPVLVR